MMEGLCDTIDLSGYDWGSDFGVTTFVDNLTLAWQPHGGIEHPGVEMQFTLPLLPKGN